MTRLNYQKSLERLIELKLVDPKELPAIPPKKPTYDDPTPFGFNIFRMLLIGKNLSRLTIPRTYFGRSEIKNCQFDDTDLSESTLCWNDFINTSFIGADLKNSDLRASIYQNVDLTKANLSNCDLRRSDFKGCTFEGANMNGAKLTRIDASLLSLSQEQRAVINWQSDDGEEPSGG